MTNLTILIFGNQILVEIINELKLFSEYKIKFYDNLNFCMEDATRNNHLVIFYLTETDKKSCEILKKNNFPIIMITKSTISSNILSDEFVERLNIPFSILNLKKKIVSLSARYKFKESSLINLHGYTINKNERKIKKDNLELQLTEKEINFLILFSQNNKPLSKNFVLNNVWNYSPESDTHTVETHIHRLRKKISQKFNDNNFIKNTDKGYYI